MRDLPQVRSAIGPEPTSLDVRYLVAIEGKGDIPRLESTVRALEAERTLITKLLTNFVL